MLDLGDQVLVLSHLRLPGNVSGLGFEQEFVQLITPRGALAAREQAFMSWDKGLRAAGLALGAIAMPTRGNASPGASSAG